MTANTIMSKMTFYDIVTLIVPSSLVCYACDLLTIKVGDPWYAYVAQFGVVMMLGLFLKCVSSFWGRLWLRNNTDIIKQERILSQNVGGEIVSCSFLNLFIFDPLKYICSIVMYFCYSEDSHELKEYYIKYTKAYDNSYSGKRIEILESHVAFLQTWILALIICMFGNNINFCNCETKSTCSVCILMLLSYICILIMLHIQRKIYRMVFESE